MTIAISGTTGITLDGQFNSVSTFGFKNRLINSAMVIDQRNAGAAVTVNNATDFYPVDRFLGFGELGDGVYTLQQSSTAPDGFVNSIIATVTTADASVGSGQYYFLSHRIEGTNCSDLNWGATAASAGKTAQTVTLSFWVRSSLTGQFGGSLTNDAFNRAYPFTYTINSANTWEQKSVTVAGDTSGTWLTTTGIGMRIYWDIGSGSSNVGTAGAWGSTGYVGATGDTKLISTNGATFYITGVQLEKGSTATSFDYRPYGTELALCQRYFVSYGGQNSYEHIAMGQVTSATVGQCIWSLPVEMRIAPGSVGYSAVGNFAINDVGVQNAVTGFSILQSGTKTVGITVNSTGMTATRVMRLVANNSTAARLTFSAEL